jgi:hypothetical protein
VRREPLYENGPFWVTKAAKGFEVYESLTIYSVRRAIIGYKGQEGLDRAKAEADRRAAA